MEVLDGKLLQQMIIGAATILEQNKDSLDAMNVFPVPDGDTGTNMSLTMISAAKEVADINDEDISIKRVTEALGLGALKGARGNSGVILSQIFAGFVSAVTEAGRDIDVHLFASAMQRGVEYAYKAVMKPKEGTILTVAKNFAESAELVAKRTDDIEKQIEYALEEAEETLKKTPELLPVLKEAGVVDAGGAGFLVLVMGFKAVLGGAEIESGDFLNGEKIADFTNLPIGDDIEFGYCTEFFIKNLLPEVQDRHISAYRNKVAQLGDSVIVVGDQNLVKTHVHTNEPGTVLALALELGELSQIKIDNMREQHREIAEVYDVPSVEKKPLAVVAVCTGDGIKAVFQDWQIDGFVEGGQSMNPSTQDILQVIDQTNAENIIVLPNNKNIILAAEQAADLCKHNVVVVKSNSIPQGIAAAIAYDPDGTLEANVEHMEKAIKHVKTGQITNAVRDTKMNGNAIKEGEMIGIADGKIVVNNNTVEQILPKMMQNLTDDESEIVTIYYGNGVAEEDANKLYNLVKKDFPTLDTELVYGGQPVYQYLISVE